MSLLISICLQSVTQFFSRFAFIAVKNGIEYNRMEANKGKQNKTAWNETKWPTTEIRTTQQKEKLSSRLLVRSPAFFYFLFLLLLLLLWWMDGRATAESRFNDLSCVQTTLRWLFTAYLFEESRKCDRKFLDQFNAMPLCGDKLSFSFHVSSEFYLNFFQWFCFRWSNIIFTAIWK